MCVCFCWCMCEFPSTCVWREVGGYLSINICVWLFVIAYIYVWSQMVDSSICVSEFACVWYVYLTKRKSVPHKHTYIPNAFSVFDVYTCAYTCAHTFYSWEESFISETQLSQHFSGYVNEFIKSPKETSPKLT